MIDISNHKVKIACPACKSQIEVTMKQIAEEKTVSCKCGQKFKLQDKNNIAKKSIKDVNKAIEDLNKTLRNLGR